MWINRRAGKLRQKGEAPRPQGGACRARSGQEKDGSLFLCQNNHSDDWYHQNQCAQYPPNRILVTIRPSLRPNDRRCQRCETTDQSDQHRDEPSDKASQYLNRRQRDGKKKNRHHGRNDDVIDNSFHLNLSC